MNSNTSFLYQAALKAFTRHAEKQKLIPLQPSELFSKVGRKYVQLRNGRDLIAKFNIKTRKFV